MRAKSILKRKYSNSNHLQIIIVTPPRSVLIIVLESGSLARLQFTRRSNLFSNKFQMEVDL